MINKKKKQEIKEDEQDLSSLPLQETVFETTIIPDIPDAPTPDPTPDTDFGGGTSDGGGASSDW